MLFPALRGKVTMKQLLFFLLFIPVFSCNEPASGYLQTENSSGAVRVMFWNTENFFDIYDDSLKLDNEFLPSGIRVWTKDRYERKRNAVYKVIVAAGEWSPPEIIGLCEIENGRILSDLLHGSPFSYYGYRYIHFESPDRRGIDVALLYDPLRAEALESKAVNVKLSDGAPTRDILYARMRLYTGDTVSFFVNHWPSKYGGSGISEPLREDAAAALSAALSELFAERPGENVIIMGDLNDTPDSRPVTGFTEKFLPSSGRQGIVNLSADYKGEPPGTIRFEGSWQLIDQVMVSSGLLSGEKGLLAGTGSFRVFSPGFLLKTDEVYGGKKPNRTFSGFAYQGGFSDHLPVILDLSFSK